MTGHFKCRIAPSETFAVILTRRLFSDRQMDFGTWMTPGYVFGVTEEELWIANELLAPHGVQLIQEGV